jgi:asparagine synthase (glutamine-hydrolysing)
MVVGQRAPQVDPYWEPDLWATPRYTNDEDFVEHYQELLTDSVRRLSRSQRSVAIEVSGGLDSSAVFCLAEHLRRADRLPAPGIHGYTLAFAEGSGANEVQFARAVGEYLGIPIEEIAPATPPISWYEERACSYRDFPGFPNMTMFLEALKHAASLGCRTVLTGHVGDAWTQGSRDYYAEELAQRQWAALRDSLRADVNVFGPRRTLAWFGRYGVYPLLPVTVQRGLRQLVRRIRGTKPRDTYWLSPRMRQALAARRELPRPWSSQQVRTISQRDLLENLYDPFTSQALESLEREAARAGLEVRHPFNTRAFVQFAFSTPARLRLRGDRTKLIHVQAMRGLMPPDLLDRKTKAEFSITLRLPLKHMKATLTQALPQERAAWLDPAGMARLFGAYEDSLGWPPWVLWSIFGADRALT